MANAVKSLRRVILISTLSIVLFAMLFILTYTARAQQSGPTDSPSAVDAAIWSPVAGTQFNFLAGAANPPQIVVRVTKSLPAAFNLSSARYRVWTPGMGTFTQYTALVGLANSGDTAVMTATTIPLYGTGQQIEFLIDYVGVTTENADALYPIHVTYKSYLPNIAKNYPPLLNDGTNPCTAIIAEPNTNYSTVQDVQYRFFSMTVPTTSTVYMTVTNFPVDGQMQLRRPPTSGCAPTDATSVLAYTVLPADPTLAAYSIAPGKYLARFNATTVTSTTPYTFKWSYVPGSGLLEPNNSLCSAIGVLPSNTYQAYPNDAYDYYYFDSSINGTIQITVAGFNAVGQYQLIKQKTNCTDFVWPPLQTASAQQGVVTLTAVNQTPGRYFLGVLADSGFNSSQLYSFRILLTTNQWNPISDSCLAFYNCPSNKTGGTATIYWKGMYGVTALKMQMNAVGYQNCPKGGSSGIVYPGLTESGSYTFNNMQPGWYAVYVDATGPAGQTYHNEIGIKMDCNFALSGADLTPTPSGPQQPLAPTPIPPPPDVALPDQPPAP